MWSPTILPSSRNRPRRRRGMEYSVTDRLPYIMMDGPSPFDTMESLEQSLAELQAMPDVILKPRLRQLAQRHEPLASQGCVYSRYGASVRGARQNAPAVISGPPGGLLE